MARLGFGRISLRLVARASGVVQGLPALDASISLAHEALRVTMVTDPRQRCHPYPGLHQALVREGARAFGTGKETEPPGASLRGLRLITEIGAAEWRLF